MTDLIGRTLGSYTLEALLGSGPAGHVFRARHVRLDRPVALKVAAAPLAATPGFAQRFTAALRAAAALSNAHVAVIDDFGEDGGVAYVVEELFADGSLRTLLQRNASSGTPWPLSQAVGLVRQAADGLAYAHTQGVVHGGIKPENLLLRRDAAATATEAYTLKISDFGIGRLLSESNLGTPAYLSPEQTQGRPPEASSDIYSLGVVLYETCTGYLPFAVRSLAEAAEKHGRAQPVPPRRIRPQLPAELEAIILRCLGKQPQERFPAAVALSDALGQVLRSLSPAQTIVLAGPATQAAPAPPATPTAPPPVAPIAGAATIVAAPDPLLSLLLNAVPTTPPAPPAAPAAQPAALPAPRIDLRLNQEQIAFSTGRAVPVYLTLTNSGTAADSITLSVEGLPGAWVRGPDQPVRVEAGGQASVSLLVDVPREPESLAGDYVVMVSARSGTTQTEVGAARGRWTVLPFAASSLLLSPRRTAARSEAYYQVTLRNEGNQVETYVLSAEDSEQQLDYQFAENSLTLDSGQAATVDLTVLAPQRLVGTDLLRSFEVYADAGNQQSYRTNASFIHQPIVPIWTLLAAVASLLVLALLFSALATRNQQVVGGIATPSATATVTATFAPSATPTTEPGAPVVSTFSVQPALVAPGQVVTVTWVISGAERVVIEQFGDVATQGSRQYVMQETTNFSLIATGGGKETRRVIQGVIALPTATLSPTLPTATGTRVAPTNTTIAASATLIPATVAPIPPSATVVLPTSTVIPPSATVVPPTSTVVPPSATVAPPIATSTTAPLPVVDLQVLARNATWSNESGQVGFGAPFFGRDNGGWVDVVNNPTLENGNVVASALQTVPSTNANAFMQGQYTLQPLQPGQFLQAELGFGQGTTQGISATVQITVNNQLVYEGVKIANGQLSAINVDLAPFTGQPITLVMRVAGRTTAARDGLHWVRPRIAGAGQ